MSRYTQKIFKPRSGKYNATRTVYNGRKYDSKFEARYAEDLDWRIKAGEVKEWIPQVRVSLDVAGAHITNYYVDFKVIHSEGSTEYVEVKGYETALWKMKRDLFVALLPEIDPGAIYTVVKQPRSNWFVKKRIA